MGRVWKFGDNINTDLIISGKYKFKTLNLDELSKHAMEALDPQFSQKVRTGDLIVAGWNFGCGSSREQAPLVLKHLGLSCVIAKSFARIFYRNCINIGLPVLECPEAYDRTDDGDEMEIDLSNGLVKNLTKNLIFKTRPIPPFLLQILQDGGLIEHYKKRGGFIWDTV